MTIALGIVALLVGVVSAVGQLVSAVDFPLAQRLGLQEKDAGADPLSRRLELNAARWDLVVLWTMPVAGVAMLTDASWWPWIALIAGGVYADTGGREMAKVLGLRREGVRTGRPSEVRTGMAALAALSAVGAAVAVHALVTLA